MLFKLFKTSISLKGRYRDYILKVPKERIVLQFMLIHVQFIGVSFDPLFAPIQQASDFSRLSFRDEKD